MEHRSSFFRRLCVTLTTAALVGAAATGLAQRGRPTPLADGPWIYRSGDMSYRAVVVTKGLAKPWSMAFLPDGAILITELGGRLRIVRNGMLDPNPVAGVPTVYAVRLDGLMDIALHPRFAENNLVYLTYSKAGPDLAPNAQPLSMLVPDQAVRGAKGKTTTNAVWRARWDGKALVDGKDIFVADNWIDDSISQTHASRMVFGRDGLLVHRVRSGKCPGDIGQVHALPWRPGAGSKQSRWKVRALEGRRDGSEGQPVRRQSGLQA